MEGTVELDEKARKRYLLAHLGANFIMVGKSFPDCDCGRSFQLLESPRIQRKKERNLKQDFPLTL